MELLALTEVEVLLLLEERLNDDDDDDQGLLIDQKTCNACLLAFPCGHLLFFCGICRRSRISLCISWHFDYNQAQLVS